MVNKKTKPHPILISNWKVKTQAKVGDMLIDIVRNNPGLERIEISGITELSKKYHIGDHTFKKYLEKSIYQSSEDKNYKKSLVFGKLDIILIKEIIYLQDRYERFDTPQKNIIRCLISKLGKTL